MLGFPVLIAHLVACPAAALQESNMRKQFYIRLEIVRAAIKHYHARHCVSGRQKCYPIGLEYEVCSMLPVRLRVLL